MANKHQIKKGQKFGHLTIIKEGDKIYLPCGQSNRTAICICDCGKIKTVRLMHLYHGKTLSCGCGNGIPANEKSKSIYIVNYHGENIPFMYLIHKKKLWLHMASIRSRIKRGW